VENRFFFIFPFLVKHFFCILEFRKKSGGAIIIEEKRNNVTK